MSEYRGARKDGRGMSMDEVPEMYSGATWVTFLFLDSISYLISTLIILSSVDS